MYRHLSSHHGNCVMVVYRNTRPSKIDPDSRRRFGETGQSEKIQLDADREWWLITPARQPKLKGVVYVADGVVTRVRAVQLDGAWDYDDRGYADVPLTAPLTDTQFPTLGIRPGDARSHVRGKIREYQAL